MLIKKHFKLGGALIVIIKNFQWIHGKWKFGSVDLVHNGNKRKGKKKKQQVHKWRKREKLHMRDCIDEFNKLWMH